MSAVCFLFQGTIEQFPLLIMQKKIAYYHLPNPLFFCYKMNALFCSFWIPWDTNSGSTDFVGFFSFVYFNKMLVPLCDFALSLRLSEDTTESYTIAADDTNIRFWDLSPRQTLYNFPVWFIYWKWTLVIYGNDLQFPGTLIITYCIYL